MPKITGLLMKVYVEDSGSTMRDLGSDIKTFSFDSPVNLIDVTGVDKNVMERLRGLADISFQLNGVFNTDSGKSHDVLSTTSTSDKTRKVKMFFGNVPTSGGTVNFPGVAFDVLFNSYNISRGDDGGLTWTTTGESARGRDALWLQASNYNPTSDTYDPAGTANATNANNGITEEGTAQNSYTKWNS